MPATLACRRVFAFTGRCFFRLFYDDFVLGAFFTGRPVILSDSGGLDMGKGRNVGLGRLREALNLNQPGQSFSFSMIPGRLAKVSVSHRIDGENIYAEVKAVARV